MRQLSQHDAAFLYADTSHTNANVTLVHIYDQTTAPGGRVRFKDILGHIESRLHLSPVFRQKLLRLPFDIDYPYWIEDDSFDLEFHVRHIALPKPGDWRQFCIQVSRLHARPLDLNRPLWEIYVIEGLDAFVDLPVGSFALVTKLHHAALDVEAHNEITSLLHDATPTPPPPAPPEPWFPESPPGNLALTLRGLVDNVWPPTRLIRPGISLAQSLKPLASAFVSDVLNKPSPIALTRFNGPVSPYRAFETRRFPLNDLRSIRSLVPGAKVNDVILALCGDALRRYLDQEGELPSKDLWAIGPVRRHIGDAGDTPPQVVWLKVPLGTRIGDPIKRLKFIQQHTARAAEQPVTTTPGRPDDATATLAFTSKFLTRATLEVDKRAPQANCTVTSVAGPEQPLYLIGARMTYFSALMPITDGMGLVFAVTRYDGKVIISPTFCREQVPNPEVFAQCLRDSFQDYLALAQAAAASGLPPRPRKKPQTGRTKKNGTPPGAAA